MADPTLYIYKIQAVRPEVLSEGSTEEEERLVSEHFNYLKELTRAGVVHLAGRTLSAEYGSFGIVIFSAGSDEAARRIMLDDPAVKGRVMRAELYPFRIALLGELHKS